MESLTLKKNKQIRKRDGTIEAYDEKMVLKSISHVMAIARDDSSDLASNFAQKVTYLLEIFFQSGFIPRVSNIEDLTEQVLADGGRPELARDLNNCRKQLHNLHTDQDVLLDANNAVNGYLKLEDWRARENSNICYSSSGLMLHLAGSTIGKYTLENVYTPEIANAHRNGDIHIHDLSMGIVGYCTGWSIRQLIMEGFDGISSKMATKPAKHLDALVWHLINFVGTLQNEWAGAQAFSSFDTYLAPFVKIDDLDYDRVYQCIQAFVFNSNISSRWGGQTPFSNITLDWMVPDDMRAMSAIIGGEEQAFTYGDCQAEMDMINKALIEVLSKGDAEGRIFSFPIPTYNITKDFNWNSPNAKLLFKMTNKYGIPYFQNFVNSNLNPSDVRSMCCRLRMDLRELRNRGGGLFGSDEMTGSVGVVTINLPRIGFLTDSRAGFYNRLKQVMGLARNSLEVKKKAVQENINRGLMPYTKRYLGNLNNHFLTIGIVGMNEAIINHMGRDENIATTRGIAFASEVLDFMRETLSEFQEATGNLYNLEATPAESTAYRLAKIDKEIYPDITTSGDADVYYTNSSQLPVGFTRDVFEALDLQDTLQVKYTGGTVLHIYLGERISDWKTCRNLVRRIAHNYNLPYFSITPTFSICQDHGYVDGEHFLCPKCFRECEVFSRVVGYYTPVHNWNKGKKAEYKDRIYFDNNTVKAVDDRRLC